MSTTWQRHAWWAVGALALLVLLVLAWVSPQRQQSLGASAADGPLRHVAVDVVQQVRVQAGGRAVQLQRGASGWRIDGKPLGGDSLTTPLEVGLRLLHRTPPERRLDAEHPEFGLATPVLTLDVRGADGSGATLVFGASNPIGLSRYVRVTDGPEAGLVLLPGDVHDHWQQWLRSVPP